MFGHPGKKQTCYLLLWALVRPTAEVSSPQSQEPDSDLLHVFWLLQVSLHHALSPATDNPRQQTRKIWSLCSQGIAHGTLSDSCKIPISVNPHKIWRFWHIKTLEFCRRICKTATENKLGTIDKVFTWFTPSMLRSRASLEGRDLAIFCRVFSLQIAYLWKHKYCTQEDSLVTAALCTMCKETEVKFLIRGQETPKMENVRKKKTPTELLSFSLPNLLLFPSSDSKAWAPAEKGKKNGSHQTNCFLPWVTVLQTSIVFWVQGEGEKRTKIIRKTNTKQQKTFKRLH